jgi:tRNA 2-thiouridine synthesizing protein E
LIESRVKKGRGAAGKDDASMRYFTYKGKKYKIDPHGFLIDPDEWDENFAEGMAPKLQIPGGLTKEHWKVIYFIRNTFERINTCPLVYVACKRNDIGLGDLKRLFPRGYLRGACKLAGITYHEGRFQQTWLKEHDVYHTRMYERKSYPFDEHGFLLDPSDWDENFAVQTAFRLKMPDYLTERHWEIIYYLRKKFEETGEVPTVYETCEESNVNLEELEKLFPTGYHRGAVRIAGLRVR